MLLGVLSLLTLAMPVMQQTDTVIPVRAGTRLKIENFNGETVVRTDEGMARLWGGRTSANTFTMLASMFPNMKFMIAEYGPEQRAANDIIWNLPNNRGVGTFNWEPTTQGSWNTGHNLFVRSGTTYNTTADIAIYDQMKVDYASRL